MSVLMTHRFGISMSTVFASLGMKPAQNGSSKEWAVTVSFVQSLTWIESECTNYRDLTNLLTYEISNSVLRWGFIRHFSPLKANNSTQLTTRGLFKTDKVALNNFVDCNDEKEWLYGKLYIGTNKLKLATQNLCLELASILHYWQIFWYHHDEQLLIQIDPQRPP